MNHGGYLEVASRPDSVFYAAHGEKETHAFPGRGGGQSHTMLAYKVTQISR